jgi:ribonuclease J
MNCLALEQGDDVLVVDCGVRFPYDDLGVDVVHPSFAFLEERAERVRGVFLTHGHEDHIGALPYLLGKVRAPVYGPAHALGLARRRLDEHGYGAEVDLRVASPKTRYEIGSFAVEPVRVAHSIVEATALAIRTSAGTVVHTGDFNFDADPPDGEPTDEARLRRIAEDGVALLLSDSTNVDVKGPGGSERAVGEALEAVVRHATGRVFIALFASNIQRLMLLGDIAMRTGRKICALGRSLGTQIDIATDIGRLKWPSDLRVGPAEVRALRRDRVLVLAGGTQGEPASAMARLASDTHPDLAIEPGDTVVFSSRIIPGNDRPVFDMMADVLRRGANVVSRATDPLVHTSGHATREEQSRMLEIVRPRCFMPVHGTLHHLMRHAELARDRGVHAVQVVENGTAVLCDGTSLSVEGRVPSGAVAVGFGAVVLGGSVLKERGDLARYGIAVVALVLDAKGNLVGLPSVSLRGVAGIDGGDPRPIRTEVVRAVEAARRRRATADEVREDVRRAVRRRLADFGGVKPIVEVLVLGAE